MATHPRQLSNPDQVNATFAGTKIPMHRWLVTIDGVSDTEFTYTLVEQLTTNAVAITQETADFWNYNQCSPHNAYPTMYFPAA
jgi:hypothetical protein